MKIQHRYFYRQALKSWTILGCALLLSSCISFPHGSVTAGGSGSGRVEEDEPTGSAGRVPLSLGTLVSTGPVIVWALEALSIRGPVKGREPVVAAFELAEDGVLELTVTPVDSGKGKKRKKGRPEEPFVVRFEGRADGRQEVVEELPRELGSEWRAAELSVAAYRAGTEEPIEFELFALGVGKKAVGSVVVRQLRFGPEQVAEGEHAEYSFLLMNDFDRARVDLLRGETANELSAIRSLESQCKLRRNRVCREAWDGTDEEGVRSMGKHRIQVRVWRNRARSKDWTVVRLGDAAVEVL